MMTRSQFSQAIITGILIAAILSAFTNPVMAEIKSEDGERFSSWAISDDKDPITDAPIVTILTVGLKGQGFGFACKENAGANAMVNFPSFMATMESSRDVIYRIDADKPVTKQWVVNGQSLFLKGPEALRMAARLQSAKKLVLRSGDTTMYVPLESSTAPLKQYVQKCQEILGISQ